MDKIISSNTRWTKYIDLIFKIYEISFNKLFWQIKINRPKLAKKLKQNNPLVSIIMPTKNRGDVIGHAIDSVLSQTHLNWELIIVDDSSSENTLQIVKSRYSDNRIRIINSKGKGCSAARNTGLDSSNGTIIAYLDDDNVWRKNYLQKMLLEMLRTDKKTAYSWLLRHHKSLKDFSNCDLLVKSFNIDSLKYKNYIDLNVFMHHRDIYEDLGGFDTTLERMVDWDLIIKYCEKFPPARGKFIGADYNALSTDRITNTQPSQYLNVIRNKYWIDWNNLHNDSQQRHPNKVSIIICVHNNKALTNKCLKSIYRHQAGINFEIVIVDNGSKKSTRRLLKKWNKKKRNITLITVNENLNFSLGNNIGFARSTGSRIVFLNNDTEVTPEWLTGLIDSLEDHKIKGVQPQLVYPDGTIQSQGHVFSDFCPFAYDLYKSIPSDHKLALKRRKLRSITAACMAMRAHDFIQSHGFDPMYVNGQEDVDLCLRLGKGDNVFTCCNGSVVIHHESKTTNRTKNILQNREIFYNRWSNFFPATDKDIYRSDNISIHKYKPDISQPSKSNLAIYSPDKTFHIENKLLSLFNSSEFCIQIPCPHPKEKDSWGDYHFAVALSRSLARNGINSKLIFLNQFKNIKKSNHIEFLIRGLSRNPYSEKESKASLRIMWIISHPEKITDEEIKNYDIIFVASNYWACKLSSKNLGPEVIPLLQCTESEIFFTRKIDKSIWHNALYVANSKKNIRDVVSRAMAESFPISIYGKDWEGIAPSQWVYGQVIPNIKLPYYYSCTNVVMNDHWLTMKNNGFLSNRFFDVLACGTPLLSDNVNNCPEEFSDLFECFENYNSLSDAIDAATKKHTHKQRIELSNMIRHEHSFNARVRTILNSIAH